MPLIRCPKCGQAYDVPGVIAVRLQNSIATCTCGEWLSGSKAAVLARVVDVDQIREIDMKPYRVEAPAAAAAPEPKAEAPARPSRPRSVRIVARGNHIQQYFNGRLFAADRQKVEPEDTCNAESYEAI